MRKFTLRYETQTTKHQKMYLAIWDTNLGIQKFHILVINIELQTDKHVQTLDLLNYPLKTSNFEQTQT